MMNRRSFLKKASLLAAGLAAGPYIFPSGSLFARTSSRKARKVVLCLFAGGVRILESIQQSEGNLMPAMLVGSSAPSSDIAHSFDPVPQSPLPQPLQQYGTLFKQFSYAQGPTGHYQGHMTALIGRYVDNSISLRARPPFPTIFEYYLKHQAPDQSALQAWWISNSLGTHQLLNYSSASGYGSALGANHLAPNTIINETGRQLLGGMIEQMHPELVQIDAMRSFLDRNFKVPGGQSLNALRNSPEDQERLQNFLNDLYRRQGAGEFNDPWGAGRAFYNDMRTVFFAEQVLETFKPELMVVNMEGVDICHNNFTEYCNNLRKADFAVAHLWDFIQKTPGMANETVLVIAPEIGRNLEPNTIRDSNGRLAIDHTGDEMSRQIFCLVVGPPHIIKQGQIIDQALGDDGLPYQSVDLAATVAYALGFDTAISGMIEGRPLREAFV